jgi:Ca2+-binding RTX toxin-like protein
MNTQAAAGQGTSNAGSPIVKIPMMTLSGSGIVEDTTLQDLQNNLYVNVKVLGFGAPNGTVAPISSGANLAATDLSVQDPATEKRDSSGATERVTIDTGSWATVLSQGFVTTSLGQAGATFPTDLSGYPYGQLTYSSSKNTETGHWVPITIGFPDASNPDGSMVTTTLTALITDAPGNHAMMGVGMNAAFSIPTTSGSDAATAQSLQVTPDYNAFLSVAQMRDGAMAHSFAIKNDGIYLGEDKADAQAEGGWTLQGLQRSTIPLSPSGIQDWRFPVADVSVGGRTYTDVSMMNDTGIPNMYLETGDGNYETQNQTVSFSFAGDGGSTRWSYTSPGSGGSSVLAKASGDDQRLAPSKLSTSHMNPSGTWTDTAKLNVGVGSEPGYTNTGLNVLRGFNYLYDADNGVFGLSSTDRNLPSVAPNPSDGPDPDPTPPSAPVQGDLTAPTGVTLVGSPGDDTIVGAGSNTLLGKQGDDLITAGVGANTVWGGQGNDGIAAGDGDNLLLGNEGSDTIGAGNGNNTIVGGQDSTDGSDLVTSGAGRDLIFGNGGDDTVVAGGGADTVLGGFGRDVLLGNQGEDVILGNQGDDALYGGYGSDTLVGGQGNDVLYGNEGDDVLYGNEGLNTFVFAPCDTDFESGQSTGDAIMDFVSGTSRIDFASGPDATATNFAATSTTSTSFAQIQAAAQTLISGGVTYAFVADGVDGFLFTTGGTGTTITDAVKLAGAGAMTSLTYKDVAHGAMS